MNEKQRSAVELEDENVKLRFKNKQLAAQIDALDAHCKKAVADAAEAQALYEDSLAQVRRDSYWPCARATRAVAN